jgi:very-short-patch-repair endonuclease
VSADILHGVRHEIRAALERAEREAAAQFGLLRYDEARRCGLSRDAGRRLVRDRRWQLAMPSVFSVTTGELEPVRLRAAAVLSLRPLASDEHPPVALHGVSALQLECDTRPRHVGNTLLRRALRAVGRGDRSVAEAALADLIDAADVPAPERLTVLQTSIGPVTPDFLWPRLGLYAQVDGREWHLTPEDWQHDIERQNALAVLGLTPLRYPAIAVLRRGREVMRRLETELRRRQAGIVREVPIDRDVG